MFGLMCYASCLKTAPTSVYTAPRFPKSDRISEMLWTVISA